jgi:hypothetical protein
MKNSYSIFLFSFVFLSGNTFAMLTNKGEFSGIVKDRNSGNPIEGASVYIADQKIGSSTDSKGLF